MSSKHFLAAALLAGSLAVSMQTIADDRPIPSLSKATEWLNSPPLTPAELRGKVVLVDFWTYTCVNWIRTLPYVRAWAEKYKDHGLVVVGVHSPEFVFEKEIPNIRQAATALRVDFPIAVDSDHDIWNAYSNQYWPAVYLVDANGRVRHHQFGEGDYERIETAIQELLVEAGKPNVPRGFVSVSTRGAEVAADWNTLRSPENYLGSLRTEGFVRKAEPARLRLNQWTLAGDWKISADSVLLEKAGGRIAYRFHARDVNLVMGSKPKDRPLKFRVLLDGKPPGNAHGTDIDEQGYGTVSEPRLYQLIRQPGAFDDRLVEIEFVEPDVQAFSFTFG